MCGSSPEQRKEERTKMPSGQMLSILRSNLWLGRLIHQEALSQRGTSAGRAAGPHTLFTVHLTQRRALESHNQPPHPQPSPSHCKVPSRGTDSSTHPLTHPTIFIKHLSFAKQQYSYRRHTDPTGHRCSPRPPCLGREADRRTGHYQSPWGAMSALSAGIAHPGEEGVLNLACIRGRA